MKDFIKASNIDLWDIIESGYNPLSRIDDGIIISKTNMLLKLNGLYQSPYGLMNMREFQITP